MATAIQTRAQESRRDPRYERWRWQIFAITWLAYAAFYFTRKAFSVAKVGIVEDPEASLLLTKATMANLDAVYLTAYAVGQFTWGMLADRLGPRVTVLGGLALSVAAAVVMGTAATLPIFATMMLAQGLAQSTGWSGLCKNLGNFFSTHERGRVLGFWSTCYAFGGLAGSSFVGWWAYEVVGDWRAAFFAAAAVVSATLVLFWLLQRNTPEDVGLPAIERYHGEQEAVLDEHEKPDEEPEGSWKVIGEVLRDQTILLLGLTYFLLKPARYAILLWGPTIVLERLPTVGKLGAAVIPAAFELAGLLGPILIGFASDRLFGARRMPACVLSLAALAVMLALFVPLTQTGSVWLMLGILFFIGLTLYGPDSMISGAAAIDFGTRKGAGTAAGFINGCGSVGAIFGGLLPGYVETGTLFYGFAGATVVAMLLLLPFWNRRPATYQPSPLRPHPTNGLRPAAPAVG
jgi:sugar phosphate permease